jgi:hypothetical protein
MFQRDFPAADGGVDFASVRICISDDRTASVRITPLDPTAWEMEASRCGKIAHSAFDGEVG